MESPETDIKDELCFVDCNSTLDTKSPHGSMSDLSSEQKTRLEQLKERLQDVLRPEDDDYHVCKWLKARCFDVKKAESMFRESMRYRAEMGADKLLEEYQQPEILKEYMSGGFCGFDKEGSPIKIELFGRLDMKGIMHSSKKTDLEKTKLKDCEYIKLLWKQQSELLGKRIDGITVIFDMEGIQMTSLWRPGIQMYLHLVSMLEDNYPEFVKRLFVINAPSFINMFWRLCKPLVSEDMRKKIKICSSSYQGILLQYVDADQLPVCFGGERTDANGDPRCKLEICQGGEVPASFYLSETKFLETMDCDTIRAGNKLNIVKLVEQPNTILKWEFRTDDHDIGFGVLYKPGDISPEQEVVPGKRIKSHQIMEDGQYLCKEPGTYIIVFNNSHSWWTSKMVYHKVELLT